LSLGRVFSNSVSSGSKNGYPTGYPLALSSGALNIYLKHNQRRSDYFSHLYLIVFKPNGLLYVYSFQSDEVKAKRLFCLISYRIDRLDGAFKPSERAITGHID
jgi:hypothetical protein